MCVCRERRGREGAGVERQRETEREKKYQRSMQFTDRLFCLDFYTSKHVNVWPKFFICNKGVYSPHLLLKALNDS